MEMQGDRKSPGNSDADLKARLDKLSTAIRTETADIAEDRKASAPSSSSQSTGQAMGMGLRVASELVAGVLVGGGIGWAIDRWFGTSPFGLLIMVFVGMAAGFWNVYRIAARPTGSGPAGSGSAGTGSAGNGIK
jgi:ATP synthase protein I